MPGGIGTRHISSRYPVKDGKQASQLLATGPTGIQYNVDLTNDGYFDATDSAYVTNLFNTGKIDMTELFRLLALYAAYGSGTILYPTTQTGHVENLEPEQGSNYPKSKKVGMSGL